MRSHHVSVFRNVVKLVAGRLSRSFNGGSFFLCGGRGRCGFLGRLQLRLKYFSLLGGRLVLGLEALDACKGLLQLLLGIRLRGLGGLLLGLQLRDLGLKLFSGLCGSVSMALHDLEVEATYVLSSLELTGIVGRLRLELSQLAG